MTNGEKQAIAIANLYFPNITDEQQVKKLGEELVELAIAIERKDDVNIYEELGDCAYILLHILSRCKHEFAKDGLVNAILAAANKVEYRNKTKINNGLK